MRRNFRRRLSVPLVTAALLALLVGLALGVLSTMQPHQQPPQHRPEQNAIIPHLIISAGMLASAIAATLLTGSARWLWWPFSARTGRRIVMTFNCARRSLSGVLRCIGFVLLAAFELYLVLRMGWQATAGLSPGVATNAWGGPSPLGAFAAHGVDAIVCIAVSGILAHLVLVRSDGPGCL